MKFVKSKLAQKLIIILIALMIFNMAVPKQVKAWDFGGILFKPISSLITSILASTDVGLGLILMGIDGGMHVLGTVTDWITDEADTNDPKSVSNKTLPGGTAKSYTMQKDSNGELKVVPKTAVITDILIGPDTIFAGKVSMLNANIFEAKDYVRRIR